MLDTFIEIASQAIEVVGVTIIVIALARATGSYLFRVGRDAAAASDRYKVDIGKGLLLGLEFLVAADVVRTFLSWSVVVEIEGRWPWPLGSGKE
jgi:uncharacterized membrane protein